MKERLSDIGWTLYDMSVTALKKTVSGVFWMLLCLGGMILILLVLAAICGEPDYNQGPSYPFRSSNVMY